MAGQGPAAHPAAVAVLIDTDHLEQLGVGSGRIKGLANSDGSGRELDAIALVKVHGQAAPRGNGNFLSFSTPPGTPETLGGGLQTLKAHAALWLRAPAPLPCLQWALWQAARDLDPKDKAIVVYINRYRQCDYRQWD